MNIVQKLAKKGLIRPPQFISDNIHSPMRKPSHDNTELIKNSSVCRQCQRFSKVVVGTKFKITQDPTIPDDEMWFYNQDNRIYKKFKIE